MVGQGDKALAKSLNPVSSDSGVSSVSPLDRLLADFAGMDEFMLPAFPENIADPCALSAEQLRSEAEQILELRFELASEPEIKFTECIDWSFDPTSDPRRRWCRELNRHRWVATLAEAYRVFEDEKYAAGLVSLLVDWIHKNPPPTRRRESDPVWTLMGVGMRAAIWPGAFYRLLKSPSFDGNAQKLMLASIHDHGDFLFRFKTHANHLLRETNGLLALAGYFPFFREAAEWRSIALQRFGEEVDKQVYSDGSHLEMSSGYQWMVIEEIEAADRLLNHFGWTLPDVDLRSVLQKMYGLLVHIARPDGSWPQLGDGFLDQPMVLRKRLQEAGEHLELSTLKYIATQGEEGTQPAETSVCFPQGAFAVMRSSWAENADWLLFRAGPFGGAHGHEDKLSVEVCVDGQPLLIDPGSYTYNAGDAFRTYFVSSNAHNTVVVDGMSQTRRWDQTHRAPAGHTGEQLRYLSGDRFTYASGVYEQGYGLYQFNIPAQPKITNGICHRREVLWIDQSYWLIVDRLEATTAHRYSRVFQTSPGTNVQPFATGIGLLAGEKNASLLLLNPIEDSVMINTAIGEEPSGNSICGWASNGTRGHKVPAPGIALHQDAQGSATLLTMLIPGQGLNTSTVPAFHRRPLSEGKGEALTIDFQDQRDTFILSRDPGVKRVGSLSTSAYIAAWRAPSNTDRHASLFEISDQRVIGANN